MRGIRLDLSSGNGAKFDFSSEVAGFDTSVQNVLVAIGQKSGTDAIYEDKGNDLHDDSTAGGIVSPESLEVVLSELSSKLVNFMNNTDGDFVDERLSSLSLDVELWEGDRARFNVVASSSSGKTVGVETGII